MQIRIAKTALAPGQPPTHRFRPPTEPSGTAGRFLPGRPRSGSTACAPLAIPQRGIASLGARPSLSRISRPNLRGSGNPARFGLATCAGGPPRSGAWPGGTVSDLGVARGGHPDDGNRADISGLATLDWPHMLNGTPFHGDHRGFGCINPALYRVTDNETAVQARSRRPGDCPRQDPEIQFRERAPSPGRGRDRAALGWICG